MTSKISIVIPTIEEKALFDIIKRLKKMFGRDVEIIVVDKSSERYYKKVKATGVKVIRQRDSGVENAIMEGLRAATGNILASIDADGTHNMEGIKEGIEKIESKEADLVLGNRFGSLTKGAMSPHIIFGNKAISKIYSQFYGVNIHDVLTCLFVMTRESFESIRNVKPYRAGIAFFAIEVAKKGYSVGEVPIAYYPRSSGESKLARSKVAYGINVTSHIIRFARDYNPLLIFGLLGVILIVAGGILGIYVILNFLQTGAFTLIGRSLISFMLIIAGLLSIMAGFILDLLLEVARKLEKG